MPRPGRGDIFAGVSQPPPSAPQQTDSPHDPARPVSGIDVLLADRARLANLARRRVALLSNAACRTAAGEPSANALKRALASTPQSGLVGLFAPEHGFAADARAGAAVADHADPLSGLGVVSLYGDRRAPTAAQLAALDVLVVDLRDVGVRCYTYAATAAIAAQAALDAGLDVIVCDRPNPLGAATAGPALDPRFRSFLAYFDVPFVHGRTLGALVSGALAERVNTAHLAIIDPPPGSADPQVAWTPPSPALQTRDAVALYPALVLLEGTNVSEGRGTPFSLEAVAAPWLDAAALTDAIGDWPCGIAATACAIEPAAGDFAGATLPAVRLTPTAETGDVFGFGVRLLAWLAATHRDFAWRATPDALERPGSQGPGEQRYFIDALLGSDSLRLALARGDSPDTILAQWQA